MEENELDCRAHVDLLGHPHCSTDCVEANQ
jgi:hypothetical protein